MIEQLLEELEKYTGKVWHRRLMNGQEEMLFPHLLGTYKILKKWNKPEYVCLAGLHHSVYGTEYFKFHTPYTRDYVKKIIGEQAENLVYEFCTTEPRINSLLARSKNWSDQVYADLIDIELANMEDQHYENDDLKMLAAIRKYLIIRDK